MFKQSNNQPTAAEKWGLKQGYGFALLCLIAVLPISLARSQDAGSNAGQLWKDAKSAFDSGNYTSSAKTLQAIIKGAPGSAAWLNTLSGATVPPAAPNQQWLEPVFYMLGASYFNSTDWPDAISTFTKYQQLFPKSPRLQQTLFSLAQANLLGGHPEDAIPQFTSLLPSPSYHAKAFLLLVEANVRARMPANAISLLEKEKAQPNIKPDFLEKLNMKLFPLYHNSGNDDKADLLLQQMDADIAHVHDVPAFNALATELGDQFLRADNIPAALACYRRVRGNDQIIALQKQQIVNLQQQHAAIMALIQANPLNSDQLQVDNKDIDIEIGKDEQILARYQTLPPVLPPLLMRIGRAYYLDAQLWEAAVVYREIMRRYPHFSEMESALYGSIVIFDQLKQTARAQALCQSYLTQFPKGKYADSVGYLRGVLAYDAQDFDKAIAYFEDSLKNQPNNSHREQIELSIGDIKLREQAFDDAVTCYARYEKDYPQGSQLEKAEYRTALALLFGGKAEEADAAFHAYLQKYPHGAYISDAEYRLDVIKFADKQYDQVLADCVAWQQKYGRLGPLAEVLSLMGDCYASEDKNDEAVDAYVRSYKVAQTTEVLNYSIMAAAKLLQKQAKWEDIATMFQEFVKNNPDHPTVVAALSWIGRADIKLGKIEEGKQFLATTAKQYLNDPSREAVDEIITQLAQLYAHKRLALAVPASAPASPVNASSVSSTPSQGAATTLPSNAPSSSASAITTPPDNSNPSQELEDILTSPDVDSKPTARARILYAKSELARLQRKPEIEAQILQEIARDFKPDDLSPIILGQVGDVLVQGGQPDQAVPFYNHLMDDYDQSPVVDYAYNGLGRIAYDQGDYKKAETYYAKALDKGLAASKLKDITLGEAQTLLALNRPDDAKPLFEQVASNRAWRGEATALSVFSLGEIQMVQGKYAEANAFYQRVFVAYQKYPAIQAKAYLKSGEAFEKLGKTPEAINTYSEMLKNPSLANFPEASDAKQRLQQLAQK